MLLMMVGTEDTTFGYFFLNALQPPGIMHHRTYVISLLTRIQMIEHEHVRVAHPTVFPLTLFSSEVLVKPSPISQSIFARAPVVTAGVPLIMFFINSLFAGAAINLQSIFSR